jgi:holliday junction DNA helicase RuvA
MIAYIDGKVFDIVYKNKQVYLVVLTSHGVGYQVFVPANCTYSVDDEVKIFVSFQVREDSQTLYGFLQKEQKEMFENIIQVSGVGPKVALSIVSVFSPQEFRVTLSKADYKTLSKVPGLGPKGAKKIVLELQGVYVQDEEDLSSKDSEMFEELKEALQSLGFRGRELESMLKKATIEYKANNDISLENLISHVLKQ